MSRARNAAALRRVSLQTLLLIAGSSLSLAAPPGDPQTHSCARSIAEVASPIYAWNTPQQQSAWVSCLQTRMICALIRHGYEGGVPSVTTGETTADMPETHDGAGGPWYIIFMARSLVSPRDTHGQSCFFAQFQSAYGGWVVHKWQVTAGGQIVDLPPEVNRSVRNNEWASARSLSAMLWNMFDGQRQQRSSQ